MLSELNNFCRSVEWLAPKIFFDVANQNKMSDWLLSKPSTISALSSLSCFCLHFLFYKCTSISPHFQHQLCMTWDAKEVDIYVCSKFNKNNIDQLVIKIFLIRKKYQLNHVRSLALMPEIGTVCSEHKALDTNGIRYWLT